MGGERSPRGRRSRRRGGEDGPPLSFGAHQGVEYLLGLLLALSAIRLPGRSATPALLLAVVVVAVAALSDGPLGGWCLLGRRLHRVLDVLLVAILAASPVLLGLDDVTVVILAEAMAALMAVLVRRTSYTSSNRRRIAARAPTPPPPGPTSAATLKGARAAGQLVGRVRRDGPRALGRFVGKHTKR